MIQPWLVLALISTTPPASSPDSGPPIIVTGIRSFDAKRRFEDCLARKCPPLEEMAAALQYAESLFVAGDYQKSELVLKRTLARHGDEARRYPNLVAGLYRALARISIHQGDGGDYRKSTFAVVRSLKAGLPENDPRIVGAVLETAEMHVSLGEESAADWTYRDAIRKAGEIDRPDLAAFAQIRRGLFDYRRGHSEGRQALKEVASSSDSRIRLQKLAAKILLARLDRERGDLASSERLIAELASFGFSKPTLMHSPPIDVLDNKRAGRTAELRGEPVERQDVSYAAATEGFDYWADVGFWVASDGKVEDVELLRSKGPAHWLEPVLRSVAGRIYAPAAGARDALYKVERFSYTSLMERQSGTRIATHSAQGRIETIDLSEEGPKPRR